MNYTVTVIIPVLNAASMLEKVLKVLSEQTYPQELIEIIVVDNGSSDNSPAIAKSYGVKLLFETEKKSPYAARNIGLRHATGSIIALTDANKIPDEHWIEEGVRALSESDAELAGGQISFDLGENPTNAEVYDAITYNNNRKFVLEKHSSAAGNLFFKNKVAEKIGPFPDQFRSGMDIWWTQRAVQNGYKLVFAEKAIVHCQPRKLRAILKKSWRVGKLHPINYQQQGKSFFYILEHTFRTFAPPRLKSLKERLSQSEYSYSLFEIWWIAWSCKILMGLGRMRGLIYLTKNVQTKAG